MALAMAFQFPSFGLRLCGWRAAASALALLAAVIIVHGVPAAAQTPPPAQGASIRVVHEAPDMVSHREALARLRASRVLEETRALFGAFKLPRPLTLRTRSCGGRGGAFYADDIVTVCYEYIDNAIQNATKPDRPAWIEPDAAIRGQLLDVFIHEGAHAVFDQLKVPFLGREEEAADGFATFAILHLFRAEAPSLIAGIAHSYLVDAGINDFSEIAGARPRWPNSRQYGAPHPHPLQRLYTVICLGSGFDAARFASLVEASDMPRWRSGSCAEEHMQAARAFSRLIAPHVDATRLDAAFPGTALLKGE
jgi:hypothetical protein